MNCENCIVEHNKEEVCKLCKSMEKFRNQQINDWLFSIIWAGFMVLSALGFILLLNQWFGM